MTFLTFVDLNVAKKCRPQCCKRPLFYCDKVDISPSEATDPQTSKEGSGPDHRKYRSLQKKKIDIKMSPGIFPIFGGPSADRPGWRPNNEKSLFYCIKHYMLTYVDLSVANKVLFYCILKFILLHSLLNSAVAICHFSFYWSVRASCSFCKQLRRHFLNWVVEFRFIHFNCSIVILVDLFASTFQQ